MGSPVSILGRDLVIFVRIRSICSQRLRYFVHSDYDGQTIDFFFALNIHFTHKQTLADGLFTSQMFFHTPPPGVRPH